jgi:hypothetical protein
MQPQTIVQLCSWVDDWACDCKKLRSKRTAAATDDVAGQPIQMLFNFHSSFFLVGGGCAIINSFGKD